MYHLWSTTSLKSDWLQLCTICPGTLLHAASVPCGSYQSHPFEKLIPLSLLSIILRKSRGDKVTLLDIQRPYLALRLGNMADELQNQQGGQSLTSRARRIKDEEWESRRPEIEKLYREKRCSRKEVIEKLNQDGFPVT